MWTLRLYPRHRGNIRRTTNLLKKTWGESHHESGSDGSKDNFVNVETDVNGDVFFTKSGSKYHYEGCSSLSLAKETKRTTREKAQAGGLKPCMKCAPGY